MRSPFAEFEINTQPQFLASFKSQLFIAQDNGAIKVMELLRGDDLKLKTESKLNIVNIRAISVNSTFLAAMFSNLTKENIKAIGKQLVFYY